MNFFLYSHYIAAVKNMMLAIIETAMVAVDALWMVTNLLFVFVMVNMPTPTTRFVNKVSRATYRAI